MHKKFNKQLIIPILTLIALLIKTVFKIDIPDAAIDLSADIIMYAVSLAGLFIHPRVEQQQKEVKTDEQNYGDHGPAV